MTVQLLTVEDVAARLRLSVGHTYRLLAKSDIAVTRIGGAIRVTEESLSAYIAERTCSSRRTRAGAA